MFCRPEIDSFRVWLLLDWAGIEPLLPREVPIGFGLDVMVVREKSGWLLGGIVELEEVETCEEFPKAASSVIHMGTKANMRQPTSQPIG